MRCPSLMLLFQTSGQRRYSSRLRRGQSGLLEGFVAGRRGLRPRGRGRLDVLVKGRHAAGIDDVVRRVAPALHDDLLAGVALAGDGHGTALETCADIRLLQAVEEDGHSSVGLGNCILAPGCRIVDSHIATAAARDGVVALAAVEHVPLGRALELVGLGRPLVGLGCCCRHGKIDAVGRTRVHGIYGIALDQPQAVELGNPLLCASQVHGVGGVLGLRDVLRKFVHTHALAILDVDAKGAELLRVLGRQGQHVGRTLGRQLAHIVADLGTLVCLQRAKGIPRARKVKIGIAGVKVQLFHGRLGAHVQGGILGQGNALARATARDGRAGEGVLAVKFVSVVYRHYRAIFQIDGRNKRSRKRG